MSKEKPDYQDAKLVLKLYDLRREKTMRESRDALMRNFWPKSLEDVTGVWTNPEHPLNAPFRQVSSYWEMAYGMAQHGIVNADYLAENTGEGLFLYAKVQPYLPQLRENYPTAFLNAEWITLHSEQGRKRFEMIKARVKQMGEKK